MTANEHPPGLEDVRERCIQPQSQGEALDPDAHYIVGEEFDRAIAKIRTVAKAEALRDLAGTGLESKKISKFQAAWIRGLAREYTQGPHKIVGAFATPETNKENTP